MKMLITASRVERDDPAPPFRLLGGRAGLVRPLDELDALNPAKRYLGTLSPASRQTMRANLLRVARLLKVPLDGVPWVELRAPHFEALRARMQDAGHKASTINATLAAMKGVARQAFLIHAIPGDDYQHIQLVRGVKGERTRAGRAVELSELKALLEACERDETAAGVRDACMIALLAGGGLRRAEVVSLDVADWRRTTHALTVRGKGNKERTVYFEDGGARRAIQSWLRVRGADAGALITPVSQTGEVEPRRMTGQAVYNVLRKRAREAGVRRRFSPHSLRRFFASYLLEQGAGLGEVSELLGHASVETTAIYDRRGERAKKKAAGLITLPYTVGGRPGRRKRKGRRRRRRRA